MTTFCRLTLSLCFAFFLLMAFERTAYAYVDPGSGLLAYQSLSAILAGVAFCFRQRLRRFLPGGKNRA